MLFILVNLRGFSIYWRRRKKEEALFTDTKVKNCFSIYITTKQKRPRNILKVLDYSNSLIYGLPTIHLNKLQAIPHGLITSLPVNFRIVFKALQGLAPNYIIDLITIKPSTLYNIRSNQELLLQPPPVKTLTTLGDRSFVSAHLPSRTPLYLYTSGKQMRLTVLKDD